VETGHPAALGGSADRPTGWRQRAVVYGGAWLALWLIYLATAVGNRSETDDAFAFALQVERSSWASLVGSDHLPHLLFLPIWRGLYEGTGTVLESVDAYDVMRFVNSGLAAAAVIWFVALLHERLGTSFRAAVLAGIGLAGSYGFWRYANESDAYPIAALFAIALCWLVFAPDMRPALAVAAAAVGVVGALTHILLLVPLLVLAPLLFIAQRRWRCLGAYAIAGIVLLLASLAGLYGVGRVAGQSFGQYVGGAGEGSLGLSSVVRSPVGLGPNFVAMNVAFAYEPFVERLTTIAPTMEVDEERFAAERSPPVSRVAAPITLVSIVVLGLALLALAASHWREVPGEPILAVGLWALTLAAVVAARSPITPEAWLPLLIPAWTLVGVGIFDRVPQRASVLIVSFVLVLVVHNALAGMLVMRSQNNDLGALRAAWLVENAEEGDAILVAEGSTFERYLAYRTSADVVPLRYLDRDDLERRYAEVTERAGAVYATEGVFAPASEYCAQSRPLCDDLRDFGAEIRGDFSEIDLPPPQHVFQRA
jgi:hypothetical protein